MTALATGALLFGRATAIDVAKTTTLEDWRIDATTPAFCRDIATPAKTTLGGEGALAWSAACLNEGLNVINLVAVHGPRAYFIFLTSPTRHGVASDRETLDSILATFHFTDDASPSSA